MENVFVIQDGRVLIVKIKFVLMIVIVTENAKIGDVFVTKDGKDMTVTLKNVIKNVYMEGNALTELAIVHLDIKENIANLNHASMIVLDMEYVRIIHVYVKKITLE